MRYNGYAMKLLLILIALLFSSAAYADCSKFQVDPTASQALGSSVQGPCQTTVRNGYPIPDPKCTPGAYNPTITQAVLQDKDWRTSCVRDQATSASAKAHTYDWYGITHPEHNTGKTMVCELDHLISLELGGADTLDNIWPQCGPADVELRQRYFKQKDIVENYLGRQVKAGQMTIDEARRGISIDWTYYLPYAQAAQRK